MKEIILDTTLGDAAFRLCCLLSMLAGETNQVSIRIEELADMTSKSSRSIQKNLSELIKHGLITRIFCKDESNPCWNMPSVFIINSKEEG